MLASSGAWTLDTQRDKAWPPASVLGAMLLSALGSGGMEDPEPTVAPALGSLHIFGACEKGSGQPSWDHHPGLCPQHGGCWHWTRLIAKKVLLWGDGGSLPRREPLVQACHGAAHCCLCPLGGPWAR